MGPDEAMSKTGECYAQAAQWVVNNPHVNAVLVHGVPLLQRWPGCRYGHAWVEILGSEAPDVRSHDDPSALLGVLADLDGVICLGPTPSGFLAVPRGLFYAVGQIRPETYPHRVYTRREVVKLLADHEHYGPWAAAFESYP